MGRYLVPLLMYAAFGPDIVPLPTSAARLRMPQQYGRI